MFRTLLACCLSVCLPGCGFLLYPGNVSLPHLEEAGEFQVQANGAFSTAGIGAQAQIAYAFNDRWGVQSTAQFLTTPQFNAAAYDRIFGAEAAVMRLLKPQSALHHGSTYVLQAGMGYSRSKLDLTFNPSFDFRQTHFFVQAHGRTMVGQYLGFSFGLRLGTSSQYWLQAPAHPLGRSFFSPAVEYLNAQPLFITATPLLQGEYDLGSYIFTLTIHPSYVLNERNITPPSAPITFGARWQL